MDPTTTFCPNLACPARGQGGQGNIGIHSRQDKRFICTECRKTFAATKGTAFYRLQTPAETVALVLTLLAHGCPLQAIVVAFGFDERTVAAWGARAGRQGQAVQEHLVEQPRALGRYRRMKSASRTGGHRLDGARHDGLHPAVAGWRSQRAARYDVDPAADQAGSRLCTPSSAAVLYRRLVLVHPRDSRDVSRASPARRTRPSPVRAWRHVCIAQVVKRYERRRVVETERRIIDGTPARVETLRRRAGRRGHQYGLHRAAERHVSWASGFPDTPRARAGAPHTDITTRYVSHRYSL